MISQRYPTNDAAEPVERGQPTPAQEEEGSRSIIKPPEHRATSSSYSIAPISNRSPGYELHNRPPADVQQLFRQPCRSHPGYESSIRKSRNRFHYTLLLSRRKRRRKRRTELLLPHWICSDISQAALSLSLSLSLSLAPYFLAFPGHLSSLLRQQHRREDIYQAVIARMVRRLIISRALFCFFERRAEKPDGCAGEEKERKKRRKEGWKQSGRKTLGE